MTILQMRVDGGRVEGLNPDLSSSYHLYANRGSIPMQGATASCSLVVCDVAWQKMELTLLVWDNQAQNLGPFCWNMAPLLIRKEVTVENVYL